MGHLRVNDEKKTKGNKCEHEGMGGRAGVPKSGGKKDWGIRRRTGVSHIGLHRASNQWLRKGQEKGGKNKQDLAAFPPGKEKRRRNNACTSAIE